MKKLKDSEFRIRIETDLKLRLENISLETGIPMSEIIRISLNNFLNLFDLMKSYLLPTKKDWHYLFKGLIDKKKGGFVVAATSSPH